MRSPDEAETLTVGSRVFHALRLWIGRALS